jgi:hypothetical protein
MGSSLSRPVTATAALLIPLAMLDRRMQRAGGPGIIPFELAGPGRSEQILEAWGPDGRQAAQASLRLDFPFLVAYTALGVRLTGRAGDSLAARRPALAAAARPVAGIQVAAGACDAVENAALLGVVARGGDARLAALARRAACAKFAGLIVGWLYGAAAVLS